MSKLATHVEETKKALQELAKRIEELKPKDNEVKECAMQSVIQYDRNIHVKSYVFKSLSELYFALESVRESKELNIAKEKLDEFQIWIEKAIK